MQTEAQPIPFEEFVQKLGTIFDESEARGSSSVLVERDGTLFSVRAARRNRRRRTSKPRGLTPQDPLLGIIGIWESAEPTDIALHKHDYLAEAAADLHDSSAAAQERRPNGQDTEHDREQSDDL